MSTDSYFHPEDISGCAQHAFDLTNAPKTEHSSNNDNKKVWNPAVSIVMEAQMENNDVQKTEQNIEQKTTIQNV